MIKKRKTTGRAKVIKVRFGTGKNNPEERQMTKKRYKPTYQWAAILFALVFGAVSVLLKIGWGDMLTIYCLFVIILKLREIEEKL